MSEITNLMARERFNGYRSRYYQSLALPNAILNSKIDFGNYKFINQWRIDYPFELKKPIQNDFQSILSIAYKILTRGEYIQLSPYLEGKFSSKFMKIDNFNILAYEHVNTDKKSGYWFDSLYEKKFYEEILSEILGNSYKHYVIPQVELGCLLTIDEKFDSEFSKERVDFLITSDKTAVVVEIDGDDHDAHKSRDYSRKRRLEENGIKEIRIKNKELDDPHCEGIQTLKKEFKNIITSQKYDKNSYDLFLNSFKLAHQFQITILELLIDGILDNKEKTRIDYDFDFFKEYSQDEIKFIIQETLTDLKILISQLSELYNYSFSIDNLILDQSDKANILITYNENIITNKPLCVIQDISFPKKISKQLKTTENIKIIKEPSTQLLEFFLNYLFNFSSFREGQIDSLKRILLNKDTITLLPTGAGKSLIFQLATFLLPGTSIIVTPIKSLMHDQVENLEKKGISRAIDFSSDIEDRSEKNRIQKLIRQGQYLFVYISPERFLINSFRQTLSEITREFLISLAVIDEAHCVSEWGHDFRPAYLTVAKNIRLYCKNKDEAIPALIALTGTASENVLLDIKEDLGINDPSAIISSETFDRSEMHFNIIKCKSKDKYQVIKDILQNTLPQRLQTNALFALNGESTNSGIIFCPFTSFTETNPRGVEYFVCKIKEDFGQICEPHYSNLKTRLVNAENFQNNNFPLLIATKGYGMGIDKPNIRYIIHVNIPPSVEAYYQEAGRAGRDGKYSECYVIFSYDDNEKNKKLLDINTPLEEIKNICQKHSYWDDIHSIYHFHINSFQGKNEELKIIKQILSEINDFNREYQSYQSKFENIGGGENGFISVQKAIFRLTAIGVIANYSIDYASYEFSLKINRISKEKIIQSYFGYVTKYNILRAKIEKEKLENKISLEIKDFIEYCCELFLDYIYDYYEKGRRQALFTMVSILEKSLSSKEQDTIFRQEITNYLKRTYSKQLIEIANTKDLSDTLIKIKALFGDSKQQELLIKPVSDYRSLLSQISRTMEDFPESVGLYLLRAYVPIKLSLLEVDPVIKDINQFIFLSKEKYKLDDEQMYPLLSWLLLEITKEKNEYGEKISLNVINRLNNEKFLYTLIRDFDKEKMPIDYVKILLLKNIYKELEEIYGGKKYE
jgi:ATP-dependent DNA helicase RecQ